MTVEQQLIADLVRAVFEVHEVVERIREYAKAKRKAEPKKQKRKSK